MEMSIPLYPALHLAVALALTASERADMESEKIQDTDWLKLALIPPDVRYACLTSRESDIFSGQQKLLGGSPREGGLTPQAPRELNLGRQAGVTTKGPRHIGQRIMAAQACGQTDANRNPAGQPEKKACSS
jgi:hypothetical protein